MSPGAESVFACDEQSSWWWEDVTERCNVMTTSVLCMRQKPNLSPGREQWEFLFHVDSLGSFAFTLLCQLLRKVEFLHSATLTLPFCAVQDVRLLLPTLLRTNIDFLPSHLAGCNSNLNSTCCSLRFFCSYALTLLFEIHYLWYFCCELQKWKPDNVSTWEWCLSSLITNTQSLMRNISILSASHGSSHNLSRLGRNVICQIIDTRIYCSQCCNIHSRSALSAAHNFSQ